MFNVPVIPITSDMASNYFITGANSNCPKGNCLSSSYLTAVLLAIPGNNYRRDCGDRSYKAVGNDRERLADDK